MGLRLPFDPEVDYFLLDPVAYAPALGETGLRRLRARIDALRAEIPPPDPDAGRMRFDHRETVVRWFDQRFAVLDRDIEAIIRTHLRDGRVAAWYEDVAEALEEVGEVDLAIDWAERATRFGLGHQSHAAARRWERLARENRPAEIPDVVRTVFERWPSASAAVRYVDATGHGVIDEVQRMLGARPGELVRFQLDGLGDARLAWDTAHRLALAENDGVWPDLAAAYLAIDPVAAIRVHLRLITDSVAEADTRRYRPAARRLVAVRASAVRASGTEALAIVDEAIADLRERHRRRPSLIAALDRAGLPR